MRKKAATKEEWLEWFWCNADFGPAHDDVMAAYEYEFEAFTGTTVPKEWSVHCEE